MDDLVQKLSQTLYEHDPMNTCCKENESFDEYDLIASHTLDLMNDGMTSKKALQVTLSEAFSEDMVIDVNYEYFQNPFEKNIL